MGESRLFQAIKLAYAAHAGQTDKGGAPYINHPARMMVRADTEDAAIVAILHDVMEDTAVNSFQLGCIFPALVMDALMALTHRDGESYQDYIVRVSMNALASRVKLLDLDDNLDRSRIPNPTVSDHRRWAKYEIARLELLAAALPLRSPSPDTRKVSDP